MMLSNNNINPHNNSSTIFNETQPNEINFDIALIVLQSVIFALFSFTTIFGNILVILAVRSDRKLQTVGNLFIVSLAIADLIVGIFVMPLAAFNTIMDKWIFGLVVCQMWLSADYTACTASIFNLFVLSLDRYWSISAPLENLRRRTARRALVMIGLVWFLSALWIIAIVGWPYIFQGGQRNYPDDHCETEYTGHPQFKCITAILNFYIPLIGMYVLYARTFLIIKTRHQFSLGRMIVMKNMSAEMSSSTPILPTSHIHIHSYMDKHNLRVNSLAENSMLKYRCSVSYDDVSLEPSNIMTASSDERAFEMSELMGPNDGVSQNENEETGSNENSPEHSLRPQNISHKGSIVVSLPPIEEFEENDDTIASSRKDSVTHNSGSPSYKVKLKQSSVSRLAYQMRTLLFGRSLPHRDDSPLGLMELKAARQLGLIMAVFTICWLPYFIVFIVVGFCENCIGSTIQDITLWLGYVNSLLNPFLYAICNNNYRDAFEKLLCRLCMKQIRQR